MGFGKDGKGQILWDRADVTPGALAALDIASIASGYSLEEDFRILKQQYWVNFQAAAFDNGEGPIMVGLADGSLTSAEIEEAIEARPVDSNDYPANEQCMRPVWPFDGQMVVSVDTTNGANGGSVIMISGEHNPRWTFSDSEAWRYWVYNVGAQTLTTGSTTRFITKNYGVWVR